MFDQTLFKTLSVSEHHGEEFDSLTLTIFSDAVVVVVNIISLSLRICLQHASCVMHVDQAADSVVEQDVKDFDLEGLQH